MPVSTRSNVIQDQSDQDEPENTHLGNHHHHHNLRNPHHGLKEKMKALTQLYEQQKQSSMALRNPSPGYLPNPSPRSIPNPSPINTTLRYPSPRPLPNPSPRSVRNPSPHPLPIPSPRSLWHPPSPKCDGNRYSTRSSVDLLGDGGGGSSKEESENVRKSIRLVENNVMRESSNSRPRSPAAAKIYGLPRPRAALTPTRAGAAMAVDDDAKENIAVAADGAAANGDKIVNFACPRRGPVSTTVARKLSMGNPYTAPSPKRKVSVTGGSNGGGVAVDGGGYGEMVGVKNVVESEDVTAKLGKTSSRILVFVRVRPLSKKEKESGSRSCVRIVNQKEVYLTEFANENDYLRLKRLRGRHFTFDASFPDSSSQLEVYSASTSDLVEAVLQGRNGSVFCYGATGAGKTFTMLGTVENPGVMVLAIKDLFNKVRQRSCDGNHVVHLSYLEVYNETVRDLLSPGRPLVLREDKQGIMAAGLTQYRAYSTDEVMVLLQQGNRNRTTEPTRANETSSRSHAILQVMVEYRVRGESNVVMNRVGKLSLIDLAGSERALATDQRTLRSLEGANINRSLLSLSSCINALVEGKKHVPYRNSKLTQLLKDSLGGACNTVMIANISPSNLSFSETQNTLHWADRAKEIRTKEQNEEITQIPNSETDQAKLLLELQKENHELRAQMVRQQQKLLVIQAQSLAAASPTPSTISTTMATPPTCNKPKERKTRPSFLAGNCFTPDPKRKAAEETIKELKQTIKAQEAAMEKMKKDFALQIKQKDELIREMSQKRVKRGVVIKPSSRPKESAASELRSPGGRFMSPAARDKKRSFWDITTANSPSVVSLNGRQTRSHVSSRRSSPAPSSMLLQPGFSRQKLESLR
ncbi:hypothetical protein OSB04_005140 [Centaurea solstitialis]|uniref:Kinesin-like protein n=1 Tax=Centaurea solstitialis TaxID=347529 RepID=A0AA38TFE4_9ASTR|nr:hypothetical protein OSB04_005140 [Centaurea solstitialis]